MDWNEFFKGLNPNGASKENTVRHIENAIEKNRNESEKLHEKLRLLEEKILEKKRERIELLTKLEEEK